jgi:two-component system, LytTR family, sensor kinase
MQNPILSNRFMILRYFVLWIVVTLLLFVVVVYFLNIEKRIVGIDLVLQNMLMALLMTGIWYPINYMSWENQKITFWIANHILLFIFFSFFWIFLTKMGLRLFFSSEIIKNHFATALPFKILFGFFAYLVFTISVYLHKYYNSYINKKEVENRLSQSVKEAELTLLRNQMNPHFIFNSLNSISSLTIIDPEKAHEMVIKLSDFLRYTVHYGQMQQVPLKKELEMCEAYLAIEKIRFGEKINVQTEVETAALEIDVPSMLLQTLFENAIKHGIYNSLQPEKILFTATLLDNRLQLMMENTFDNHEKQVKIGTKTGLKNIKERLRLMYKNLAIINHKVIENKFIVSINIPVNE